MRSPRISAYPAVTVYDSTSSRNASQCRGCGTLAPARMREHAASDKPVAAAIS